MPSPRSPVLPVAVLLGAPVDDVTIAEAVDLIDGMVLAGRRHGRVHQVATVNLDFIVNAARDERVLHTLQRSELTVPDGMPVVWASRLIGTPIRERSAGVDLLPALVERAAAVGHRIVLFGARPGVAERAAALLSAQHPGAQVVGMEAPEVSSDGEMDDLTATRLREARADVVGVALGHPKQEHWIARNGRAIGAPVYIGIGGSLDFITGVTTRAPVWMQRSGFEWLHRAVREPRRLAGRYAHDLVLFAPALVHQAWLGRRRGSRVVPLVRAPSDGPISIRFMGPAPRSVPDLDVDKRLRWERTVSIDLSYLRRVDNVTVASVVAIRRAAHRSGTSSMVSGLGGRAQLDARRLRAARLLSGQEPAGEVR